MKVFKVVIECGRDGTLTRDPGRRGVEKISYHYAANCIEDVWAYTQFLRLDPELSLIGIWEILPSIHAIIGETP